MSAPAKKVISLSLNGPRQKTGLNSGPPLRLLESAKKPFSRSVYRTPAPWARCTRRYRSTLGVRPGPELEHHSHQARGGSHYGYICPRNSVPSIVGMVSHPRYVFQINVHNAQVMLT